MANPYQSPDAPANTEPRKPLKINWVELTVWGYPFLIHITLYGCWLVAWVVLGHMPRPSIDDPKSISVVVDIFYYIAGIVLIGFPAAAFGGCAYLLGLSGRPIRRRIGEAMLLVVLWTVDIMVMRLDPLRVGDWFMD